MEEVKKEVVETVVEHKDELAKVVDVVDKKVDEVVEKVEEKVEKVQTDIEKLIESTPEVQKIVDVVDDVLVGRSCGCSVFGWKLSAEKVGKTLKTPPSKGVDSQSKESK